jgi:hypothetical protein
VLGMGCRHLSHMLAREPATVPSDERRQMTYLSFDRVEYDVDLCRPSATPRSRRLWRA